MISIGPTCREIAVILVAREDRALSLTERLGLRLHMVLCDTCPRFERQMLTMRNRMRQWRNYVGPEDSEQSTSSQK